MLTKLLNSIGLYTRKQIDAKGEEIRDAQAHLNRVMRICELAQDYAKTLEEILDNRDDINKPIIVYGHRNVLNDITLSGNQKLIIHPSASNNVVNNVVNNVECRP